MKPHTGIDADDRLPVFMDPTEGKFHEIAWAEKTLDLPEGSFAVSDRGLNEYGRYSRLTGDGVFFVTRLKKMLISSACRAIGRKKTAGYATIGGSGSTESKPSSDLLNIPIRKPGGNIAFSPTRTIRMPPKQHLFTKNDGRLNSFSGGSNRTRRSELFSALQGTPCSLRYGSPCAFT